MAAGAPLPRKLSPWKWSERKQWRAFLEPEDDARREEGGGKKKNNQVSAENLDAGFYGLREFGAREEITDFERGGVGGI
jgi:hypothetical protein